MKKLVVGNWKMHGDAAMAHPLALAVADAADKRPEAVDVVVCPPALLISHVVNWLVGSAVKVGGQDCHQEPQGAFTGDLSAPMLKDAGCAYVIVGHSERRQRHLETNQDVRLKAAQALKSGLIPIICIGETAGQRNGGKAEEIVGQQVRECLPEGAAGGHFILAYEPVWAIGSGQTPTGQDIKRMHTHILSLAPAGSRVLYGGSVKPDNAADIMAIEGVSGVLVGGASVKAEEFCKIIEGGV